jgi:hypothetical protein
MLSATTDNGRPAPGEIPHHRAAATETRRTPVTDAQRERVAEASRRVIAGRQEICAAGRSGLTRLHNLVDEGAYTDLRALHRELDEAVAACYG